MSNPLARIGQRFTSQFVDGLVALEVGFVVYLVANALTLPLELAIAGWLLYLLLCATACLVANAWESGSTGRPRGTCLALKLGQHGTADNLHRIPAGSPPGLRRIRSPLHSEATGPAWCYRNHLGFLWVL